MNFVGVPGRDDLESMARFVIEREVGGFDHAVDPDGLIWEQFGITSQPAFVFIEADGTVDVVNSGLGEDALFERVEALSAS